MKRARRSDLQTIIIDSYCDRATSDAVVPMANRVRNCLAKRFERIHRLIHSREHTWEDTSGHGQILPQKPVANAKKLEGMTVKLPIVQEFRPRRAAKFGNAQHALAVLGFDTSRNAEENDSGPAKVAVTKKKIEAS